MGPPRAGCLVDWDDEVVTEFFAVAVDKHRSVTLPLHFRAGLDCFVRSGHLVDAKLSVELWDGELPLVRSYVQTAGAV